MLKLYFDSVKSKRVFTHWKRQFVTAIKRILYGIGFLQGNVVKPSFESEFVIPRNNENPTTCKEIKKPLAEKKGIITSSTKHEKQANVISDSPILKCGKCGKDLDKNPIKKLNSGNSTANNKSKQEKISTFKKESPKIKKRVSKKIQQERYKLVTDVNAQDTVLSGTCYKTEKNKQGQKKWIEVGRREFSLEKMEWINFSMSDKTKKMFLDLLDLKTNFKTTLFDLETTMNSIQSQVDVLAKEISKIKM